MKKLLLLLYLVGFGTAQSQTFSDLMNHPLSKLQFQAERAVSQGELQQAIDIYTTIVQSADTTDKFEALQHLHALTTRSDLYYRLSNYEMSLQDINAVIILDPSDLRSYMSRGETLMKMGDFANAALDFRTILEKDNKSYQASGAYYYLALIYIEENNLTTSLEYLSLALDMIPEDQEILYTRAYVYSTMMEFEKSIKDYDKLLTLDKNYAGYYANRGTARINLYLNNGNGENRLRKTACKDLKKAEKMGFKNLDDLLFLYCR